MKILITAAGTREYIDPVRYITNASSGRMGYALAKAAVKAGHKVTLISAQTALKPPESAQFEKVTTSGDMFKAVKKHFPSCNCLIMAAAVSDYKPAKTARLKLKKQTNRICIELKPTRDILKWAGNHKKNGQIVAGFALEDKNLLKNAEKKLASKKSDIIIANDISAISATKSTIYVKIPHKDHLKFTGSKTVLAKKIINIIETLACEKIF